MPDNVLSPLVVTVILNTNRCDDTLAALASLDHGDYPRNHIIVLDNASTDGSVQAIRLNYPNVHIIKLEENLGYAGNNNVGLRAAIELGADWIFVLNEDTELSAGCISLLVAAAEEHAGVGIVGPMVYHHSEPKVIQSAGGTLGKHWQAWHRGQNELDRGQFDQPWEADWISGCAIMVKREVIQQIGTLDERFFYYYEETEWCLRAREAGWKILLVPQAKLWHKGVQRNYQPGPNVTYYATRNRFLMLSKHQAPLLAWVVVWGQTLLTLISWSLRPRWRAMRSHRDAMWQGVSDYLKRRWGMRIAV